ncbi:MAG: hypothetical protein EHM78_02310 [Myxococcaceae bacterium]|nr:MAG: hypothetical protein EHM78_02310 [Myxococcaceae bacterium]
MDERKMAEDMVQENRQRAMAAVRADPVGVPPSESDLRGEAWLVPTDHVGYWHIHGRPFPASVALWLIECPWAHPIWHSYVLSLVHLRPAPDEQPIRFYIPGATHEFMIFALNPSKRRNEIFGGRVNRLDPGNFGAQMVCASDEEAAARIRDTVREIIRGDLSPDTDFTHQWVQRFGDSMMRK